ncbi:MAG TPA: pyruvate formate lyase family protein [Phycisphaerae bacterium]|nr:pyruvate formate lyase family protein [Phycisphaerae bacterium]HRY70096.1 pyruvate formate lyase family protein [Phycisphaerae bacterium]HSA27372.1 pyruvate formate lyase family protein [Phycisphaerae bacterium]
MTTTDAQTLSAQELAIANGKKVVHGTATDRVLRMYEAIRAYGPPRVALDRAVLFTESFKETENQPLVLRWAKALKHFAEKSPVTIFDDELIVGRPNTWLGRWGIVYPELDGTVMPAGVEMFRKNKGKPGEVAVTDEDAKIINEVLTPYWAGRDYATNFIRSLPEETRFMMYGPDPKNTIMMTVVAMATSPMRHSQNWTPDFAKILTRGVKGIRDEAQAKLAAISQPRDIAYKKPFLEAVIVTCDAMTIWSRRYAKLATDLAAKEKNPQRKKEMEEIAAVCEWVPENAARTFREALQAQWWGQMFNRIEQTSSAMGQGRWDQYLWPFYQEDLAEGRITKESATELLHCVWLQMAQCVELKLNPVAAAGTEGFSKFEDICLGGQTPDGLDATNDLTYLILESTRALQITCPEPCVRIHANTPDRLLHYVAEVVKDGKGFPKLLNDEMVIPFYLANGATLKEALDWTISGCCENRLINRETNVTGNGGFNCGSLVEMTFRNGRLKVFKDLQFGVQTGDPRSWTSYEDVWKAFCAQLRHLIQHALTQQYIALRMKPQFFAAPATSMLHDLAMAECRDLHSHGDYFPGAIDHSCLEVIGKATAIDSLAAVKHLIFDTKKVTWDQLLTAIESNWEGHEAIRQMCLNAPKYGNGIEWVDAIGFEMERFVLKFLHERPKPHDQAFLLRQIPITFHVPMGKVTWATPNGRKASEYLSEGISASHGMDVKGPTVSLNSMARARNLSYREKGGDLINLKFSPANVAGEEGTRRLMQIIRTWCDLKHWHIQFNIINKETLLAAQKDPEKYRNLIVRIAGYSAYFVDLSPMQQAEIIARTEERIG